MWGCFHRSTYGTHFLLFSSWLPECRHASDTLSLRDFHNTPCDHILTPLGKGFQLNCALGSMEDCCKPRHGPDLQVTAEISASLLHTSSSNSRVASRHRPFLKYDLPPLELEAGAQPESAWRNATDRDMIVIVHSVNGPESRLGGTSIKYHVSKAKSDVRSVVRRPFETARNRWATRSEPGRNPASSSEQRERVLNRG